MSKDFLVYRDKKSKKIIRYSIYKSNEKTIERIEEYNLDLTRDHTAELVFDHDLISVIEIAESNKITKERDLRDIENAIENLSNEFYLLKEAIK